MNPPFSTKTFSRELSRLKVFSSQTSKPVFPSFLSFLLLDFFFICFFFPSVFSFSFLFLLKEKKRKIHKDKKNKKQNHPAKEKERSRGEDALFEGRPCWGCSSKKMWGERTILRKKKKKREKKVGENFSPLSLSLSLFFSLSLICFSPFPLFWWPS